MDDWSVQKMVKALSDVSVCCWQAAGQPTALA